MSVARRTFKAENKANATNLRKDAVLVAWHFTAFHGLPNTVIAAFHQPPLQPNRIAEIPVTLDIAGAPAAVSIGEALELGMELGVSALCQKQEKAEAGNLVALGQVGRYYRGRQLVKRPQLLDISRECL